MKLRARSDVGLSCSDGSVGVTPLVNLEQAGQVGKVHLRAAMKCGVQASRHLLEDILAPRLAGLCW